LLALFTFSIDAKSFTDRVVKNGYHQILQSLCVLPKIQHASCYAGCSHSASSILKGWSVTAPTGLGTVVALRHEGLAALAKAFLQEKNSQSNR